MLTLTNIRRPGSDEPETLTIDNGLIKGWNLPAEGERIDGQGATVAPAAVRVLCVDDNRDAADTEALMLRPGSTPGVL